MNTPRNWKKYLEHLDQRFKDDMDEWEKEGLAIDASENEGFWEKVFDHKAQRLEFHEFDKPYRGSKRYDPELLDYFAWDVNRKKKKNVRT